jgi:hypothetical protein
LLPLPDTPSFDLLLFIEPTIYSECCLLSAHVI